MNKEVTKEVLPRQNRIKGETIAGISPGLKVVYNNFFSKEGNREKHLKEAYLYGEPYYTKEEIKQSIPFVDKHLHAKKKATTQKENS